MKIIGWVFIYINTILKPVYFKPKKKCNLKKLNNPENDKKYIYRNFEMLVHYWKAASNFSLILDHMI